MSDIVTGQRVGAEFCKALGLDPSRIVKLTLTLEPDKAVTVLVTERYVSGDEIKVLTERLVKYELKQVEEKP